MKRCAADGSSRKSHGRELCRGGKNARSSDGYRYVKELCLLLLGRKFIGYRPLWSISSLSDSSSVLEVVDLYNHTVNIVGELLSGVAYFSYMRRHLVVAVSHGTHSERLKSKLGESVKRLCMTARRVSVGVNVALLKIEHEYIKLSLSGYLGVKLT